MDPDIEALERHCWFAGPCGDSAVQPPVCDAAPNRPVVTVTGPDTWNPTEGDPT